MAEKTNSATETVGRLREMEWNTQKREGRQKTVQVAGNKDRK